MRHRLVALLVFVAGSAVTLVAWQQYRSLERRRLAMRTSLTAAQTAIRLEEFIHTRIRVVETLAASFPSSNFQSEEQFHAVAGPVVRRFGGLLAINWVDPAGVIRWVCPPGPNREARGRDLTRHPIASPFLRRARTTGLTQLTRPLPLYQGGVGFVAYIPVGGEAARWGYLNAVFRVPQLVAECLADGLAPYFAWRITCEDEELARSDVVAAASGVGEATRTLRIGPSTWRVTLHPTPVLLAEASSPADGYLLGSGIGLSLALALLVGLLAERRARRQRLDAQRREFEARMLQVQKLESLGVLAGGIAHDFNNLLLTIMGNAELAREAPGLDAEVRESLDEILVAARHAADLSRQMLMYSGSGRAERRAIDVTALLQEMEPLLRASAGRWCTVSVFVRDDLPPLRGDPSQIRQILLNLVINASEAMDDGGVVTVRVYSTHAEPGRWAAPHNLEDLEPGEYLVIEVEDHGCGMTPEVRDRIFDPFFTTKFTGRGLGMATVLGIVRAHRGAIAIDSEAGRGTTVRVFLPVAPADTLRGGEAGTQRGATPPQPPPADRAGVPAPRAMRRRPAEPAPAGGPARGRVLIVDDDDAVRTLAERMLRASGFDTITAPSGADALSLIDAHHGEIDCVLLDLSMPGMDGRAVMQAMSQRGWSIPVILSSGFSEHSFEGLARSPRPAAFIPKPYQRATLVETVASAIGRRAARGALTR